MRFEDEQYVRLYKRDTITWLMLPWQARCVLPLVLRACDRAGIIDLGDDGWEGLAVTIKVPIDLVEAAMPDILRRGILVLRAGGMLVWPKFIDGQEAKQSDKARQKAARDRARDLAMAQARGVDVVAPAATDSTENVTLRDSTVTLRDEPSRDRAVSLETVTLSCAELSRAEPSQAELSRAEGVRGAAPSAEGSAPSPAPLLVLQDPTAEPKTRKRGRLPQTYMREDWQPKPEHAEYVRAKGLDVGGIVEEFRNHWLAEGKPSASWDARFKQNVDRILRTPWLVERFARPPERPASSLATPADPPDDHETYGPPPPEALAAIERLKLRPKGDLLAGILDVEEPASPARLRSPTIAAGGG